MFSWEKLWFLGDQRNEVAKAEYRVMASVTCEITWVLQLLKDLKLSHLKPVLMFCDNQAALHIARTKHIEVDCHLVRDKIQEGVVKTFHVANNSQVAEIFTKSFGKFQLLHDFSDQVGTN